MANHIKEISIANYGGIFWVFFHRKDNVTHYSNVSLCSVNRCFRAMLALQGKKDGK